MDIYLYLQAVRKIKETRKDLDAMLKYGKQDDLVSIIRAAEEVAKRFKTAAQEYFTGG